MAAGIQTTCIKISNVSDLVNKENIKELFSCCGDILGMQMGYYKGEKICGIEFASPEMVDVALMLNGTEVGDRPLSVEAVSAEDCKALFVDNKGKEKTQELSEYERACKLMEDMMQGPEGVGEVDDEVNRTLYLGNISKACTAQDLRDAFKPAGNIIYIKFSSKVTGVNIQNLQTGKSDFRYAFVEFETQEQQKMAFTLHGKVIAGAAVKIGKAHNPIFKDETNDTDNPLWIARKAAMRIEKKVVKKTVRPDVRGGGTTRDDVLDRRARGGRERDYDGNEGDRSRRSERGERSRRRRRRRRRRSPSYEDKPDEEDEPKMFFDGYQWHFNDQVQDNVEDHVTSIIRSDVDLREDDTTRVKTMDDAAAEALKSLKKFRGAF